MFRDAMNEERWVVSSSRDIRCCCRICREILIVVAFCGVVLTARASPDAATGIPGPNVVQPNDRPRLISGEAEKRIEALRREIARHDALYFKQASPEITDSAYDRLKRELASLEAAHPGAGGRPIASAAVGDDRSGLFPLRRHRERMLSLDKVYSEAEVRAFLARVVRRVGRSDAAFVIEPKFDGLAISVTYEHGRLVRAVSRGNGAEGDDLTANVLTIRSLPRALLRNAPDGSANPIPDLIEVRGEIYLTYAEFEKINRERDAADEPVYSNPRNLAAGTVRLIDPREVAARGLSAVFYGWGACEPATMLPATQHGFHEQVRAWGLPGLDDYRIVQGADEAVGAVEAMRNRRRHLAYPVDGAVVKLDEVSRRRDLGESEQAPKWAVAYKYAPESAEARIKAISVKVGRTGLLTPVAELFPVVLAGSTVTRATLHNRATIARLDIRVGDVVALEKAGEIIPAVSGIDFAQRPADSRPYVFPSTCPACGAAVMQPEGEIAVRCPNPACPAQVRQRLRHFASKFCVKIDGLGPATIDRLVEGGKVRDISDIYRLSREDFAGPGRNSGKSADRVIAGIERSKRAELWRFIYGLSIPHVGAATARDLASRFGGLAALAAARREDFAAESRGAGRKIGDVTAHAVLAHFCVPRNRAIVADLLALGVWPELPDR
jgi:DNA ligase (NAD+)